MRWKSGRYMPGCSYDNNIIKFRTIKHHPDK